MRSLAHGGNFGAPQPIGSGARRARLLLYYASPALAAAPWPREFTGRPPSFRLRSLEAAHGRIEASLAAEVLARVKAASPALFERLVVELLLKMGYGGSRADAGQAIGKGGDEGIDA